MHTETSHMVIDMHTYPYELSHMIWLLYNTSKPVIFAYWAQQISVIKVESHYYNIVMDALRNILTKADVLIDLG